MIQRLLNIHFVAKFLIAGATATAVNISVLYVLTEKFGIWYLFSAVIAFTLAFFVSFGLQKFWTFIDHRTDVLPTQAGLYALIQVWDLSLNTLGLYILVSHFGVWYVGAQVAMSLVIAVQNFLLYRKFIFTKKPVEHEV